MIESGSVHRHMIRVDPQRLPQIAEGDRMEIAGTFEGCNDLSGLLNDKGQRIFRQHQPTVAAYDGVAHVGINSQRLFPGLFQGIRVHSLRKVKAVSHKESFFRRISGSGEHARRDLPDFLPFLGHRVSGDAHGELIVTLEFSAVQAEHIVPAVALAGAQEGVAA